MQIYKCDRCTKVEDNKMKALVFADAKELKHLCKDCVDDFRAFMLEKSDNPNIVTGSGVERTKDKIEFESEYLFAVAYDSNQDKEAILDKYYKKGKHLVQYNSDINNPEWIVVSSQNDFGCLINHLNISLRIVEKS